MNVLVIICLLLSKFDLSHCLSDELLYVDIPAIDFDAIAAHDKNQALKAADALLAIGAIQIVNVPNFDKVRKESLGRLALCLSQDKLSPTTHFTDGSHMLTMTLPTLGETPNPSKACSVETAGLRALVSMISNQLFTSLDMLLMVTTRDEQIEQVSRPMKASIPSTVLSKSLVTGDHVEYFQTLYASENTAKPSRAAIPLPAKIPIDTGLFVALASLYFGNEKNSNAESGLYIETPTGFLAKSRHREDALLFVVGPEGSQWLSMLFGGPVQVTSRAHFFKAVMHKPGSSLSWYSKSFSGNVAIGDVLKQPDSIAVLRKGATVGGTDTVASLSAHRALDMSMGDMSRMGAMNNTQQSAFCAGTGVSMYMSGFQSSGSNSVECIVLLFGSWSLDSALKLGFAWVGVFLLAVAVQYLINFRGLLKVDKDARLFLGKLMNVTVALVYGVQVVLSYFLMLIAMSYNVELFTAVCTGLMVGYYAFMTEAPASLASDPTCCDCGEDQQPVCISTSHAAALPATAASDAAANTADTRIAGGSCCSVGEKAVPDCCSSSPTSRPEYSHVMEVTDVHEPGGST